MESIEAIIGHVVENLNIVCENFEVVIITTHKLSDKVNVQFLNLLLGSDKFKFKSATIINQTLMALYAYNSNIGVIANLGEKIDIVPICNGINKHTKQLKNIMLSKIEKNSFIHFSLILRSSFSEWRHQFGLRWFLYVRVSKLFYFKRSC